MVLDNPLLPLIVGTAIVVVLVGKFKIHAFISLILASYAVGLISPEIPFNEVSATVAEQFGEILVGIGIPILMAAIIGTVLTGSGGAERIVRAFNDTAGEGREEYGLMGSSYVLSIPVFFDNVFYLLAPLARATRVRTGQKYTFYICTLAAGAIGTHTLIPPTPGPLAVANALDLNLGLAILVGIVVALPTTLLAGLGYGKWLNSRLDIPVRNALGSTEESIAERVDQSTQDLPGLFESSLPIVLPLGLIAGGTIIRTLFAEGATIVFLTDFLSDVNFALTVGAVIGILTYVRTTEIGLDTLGDELTGAVRSGGNIMAITGAGGAFGAMLGMTGIGGYVTDIFSDIGIPLLISAWLMAGFLRVTVGSATVSLITTAEIMAPLTGRLSVHPVWTMMAIGTGAMLFVWYNSSGFWIVKETTGMTQLETIKTFSFANTVIAISGLVIVYLLSTLFPLV